MSDFHQEYKPYYHGEGIESPESPTIVSLEDAITVTIIGRNITEENDFTSEHYQESTLSYSKLHQTTIAQELTDNPTPTIEKQTSLIYSLLPLISSTDLTPSFTPIPSSTIYEQTKTSTPFWSYNLQRSPLGSLYSHRTDTSLLSSDLQVLTAFSTIAILSAELTPSNTEINSLKIIPSFPTGIFPATKITSLNMPSLELPFPTSVSSDTTRTSLDISSLAELVHSLTTTSSFARPLVIPGSLKSSYSNFTPKNVTETISEDNILDPSIASTDASYAETVLPIKTTITDQLSSTLAFPLASIDPTKETEIPIDISNTKTIKTPKTIDTPDSIDTPNTIDTIITTPVVTSNAIDTEITATPVDTISPIDATTPTDLTTPTDRIGTTRIPSKITLSIPITSATPSESDEYIHLKMSHSSTAKLFTTDSSITSKPNLPVDLSTGESFKSINTDSPKTESVETIKLSGVTSNQPSLDTKRVGSSTEMNTEIPVRSDLTEHESNNRFSVISDGNIITTTDITRPKFPTQSKEADKTDGYSIDSLVITADTGTGTTRTVPITDLKSNQILTASKLIMITSNIIIPNPTEKLSLQTSILIASTVDSDLPESTAIPRRIIPSVENINIPPNSALSQIGFGSQLNYEFLLENQLAAVQLSSFLPPAIAYGLNIDTTKVIFAWIEPSQIPNKAYLVAIAKLYIPKDSLGDLSKLVRNNSSRLYNNPNPSFKALLSYIDLSIPVDPSITGLNTITKSTVNPSSQSTNDPLYSNIETGSIKAAWLTSATAISGIAYVGIVFTLVRMLFVCTGKRVTLESSTSSLNSDQNLRATVENNSSSNYFLRSIGRAPFRFFEYDNEISNNPTQPEMTPRFREDHQTHSASVVQDTLNPFLPYSATTPDLDIISLGTDTGIETSKNGTVVPKEKEELRKGKKVRISTNSISYPLLSKNTLGWMGPTDGYNINN